MSISTPPSVTLVEDPTVHEVRDTVRKLIDKQCTPADLLNFVGNGNQFDASLWSRITGELGLSALLIPEEFGGAGATTREAAAVLTELGRGVAPVPYLSSAVIATTALVMCARGGSDPAASTLSSLAEGTIAALVTPATRAPQDTTPPTVTGTVVANSIRLSGSVSHVLGADRAAILLVPASVDGAPTLVLVSAGSPGVAVTARTGIDQTRPTTDVVFTEADGTVVATGPGADVAIGDALRAGAGLLASEQIGICEWALATGIDHLTARHQFGRPIGSYQSLRHRAAQLWIDLNHARAAAMYAAGALADDAVDTGVAVAVAQAYCSRVTLHLVEDVLQMHGGIGFTWDHPIHLYLKRAFADSVILGDAETHKWALSILVDLPAPAAVPAQR